jgi:hypothetical protein
MKGDPLVLGRRRLGRRREYEFLKPQRLAANIAKMPELLEAVKQHNAGHRHLCKTMAPDQIMHAIRNPMIA